jgi:excisionase family DNA binding protein
MSPKKTPKTSQPAPMVTVRHVSAALNVTPRTVRQWVKDGVLEAVRLGGVLRFSRKRIEEIAGGKS